MGSVLSLTFFLTIIIIIMIIIIIIIIIITAIFYDDDYCLYYYYYCFLFFFGGGEEVFSGVWVCRGLVDEESGLHPAAGGHDAGDGKAPWHAAAASSPEAPKPISPKNSKLQNPPPPPNKKKKKKKTKGLQET